MEQEVVLFFIRLHVHEKHEYADASIGNINHDHQAQIPPHNSTSKQVATAQQHKTFFWWSSFVSPHLKPNARLRTNNFSSSSSSSRTEQSCARRKKWSIVESLLLTPITSQRLWSPTTTGSTRLVCVPSSAFLSPPIATRSKSAPPIRELLIFYLIELRDSNWNWMIVAN